MFGYVVINKPELKFKDFDTYQSYYCGLCKSIQYRHGNIPRFALSYELTFAYILLSSLYDVPTDYSRLRCALHPFEKRGRISNEIGDYAADMSVILSYYKCVDNIEDRDHTFSSRLFKLFLKKSYKSLPSLYPKKLAVIASALDALADGEAAASRDLDMMAGHFGQIVAQIMCYKNDEWTDTLGTLGFFLGKYIYILDAYCDLEDDMKKGHYNPLMERAKSPSFEEDIRDILTMMMAECCKAFEKLPIVENTDLLRNILYSGVWIHTRTPTAKSSMN